MKAIKKIVLYIVICLTLTTSAFAVSSDCASTNALPPAADDPMVEEVVWVGKTVDGVEYKRLWSITYGKWLTGWIRCD